MSQYYLYRHVRKDLNVPFYIGVAKKREQHPINTLKVEYARARQTTKRGEEWIRIYNASQQNIEIEILFESDSQEEINNKEREFIALYGRQDLGKGLLVNRSDGGEGASGAIRSQITREKIRIANLGRKTSDDAKEKMRQAKLGKKLSPEHIENVRKSKVGYKHSPETRNKISTALMGHKFSNTTLEKIKNTLKSNDHLRPRDSKGHYKKMK